MTTLQKTVYEDDNQIVLVRKDGGGINITQIFSALSFRNKNRETTVTIDKETLDRIHDIYVKNTESEVIPIELLGLSRGTENALLNEGIGTVNDLLKHTVFDIESIRRVGYKAKREIIDVLAERGLSLKKLWRKNLHKS